MSLNLIQNSSFESAGLVSWQTAGNVTANSSMFPVEGANTALFQRVSEGTGNSILSQAVPIDSDTFNLRLTYAIQAIYQDQGANPQFQVNIRWQRGAADNYATISEETLETIVRTSLRNGEWITHVAVSGPKPADAVQARLRFIYFFEAANNAFIEIDEVVLTEESF